MGTRHTTQPKRGTIWIPPSRENIYFKIILVDSSGDEWDLTANALNFNVVWPTFRSGGLASFTLDADNNNRQYINKFIKGNIIKFYMDYTDATMLYKTFYIESPQYGYANGYKLYLRGRDYPQLADKKLIHDFSSGVNADTCFNTVVDTHFSAVVTTDDVSANMTSEIKAKFGYQSGVKIFKNILERVDYDGRIENDGDIATFVDTGILITTEALVVGQNVLNITPFGGKSEDERNRIQVVGEEVEDCIILKMKQDITEQDNTWIKDEVHNNTDVDSLADANEIATYLRANKKSALDSGVITTYGIFGPKPGNKIKCSAIGCNINGEHFIKKVTQKFTSTGDEKWKTTFELNETTTLVSDFLKEETDKRESERNLKNPNAMTDTLIFLTFDNDTGIATLGDTFIGDGKLKLKEDKNSGILTSDTFTADSNFTEVEVRGKFNDDCSLIEVHISNDEGLNYKKIRLGDFNKIQTLGFTGKKGKIKVVLKSDSDNPVPELDSICLLIKR